MTNNFALLHGGGHGSWVWEKTAEAMRQRGAEVLALDAPGCGVKRRRDTTGLDVAAVAAELAADIRANGMRDVIVVGHSLAGTTIPAMWRHEPGLFRKLVYVSCCAPMNGQSVLEMMGRGAHGSHPDQVGWPVPKGSIPPGEERRRMFCNDMEPAQQDWFLAQMGKDDWPAAVTDQQEWRYDDLTAAPSSYVICTADGILPVNWQERFAARLGCKDIRRIDAGHQVMNTQPDALAELLLAMT